MLEVLRRSGSRFLALGDRLLRREQDRSGMAALEPHSPGRSSSAALSNAVVSLYREYTGRGPTQVRTTIRDDVVVVLLRDLLTKAEIRLVEDGEADMVLTLR